LNASSQGLPDFFISRAGKDAKFAEKIGRILEVHGSYKVILQQWDFYNSNFMDRMDAALASGARVISLLTPYYLDSEYCAAEWMHALYGDPLNRKRKLIVLRAAPCEPRGLLRTIAFCDLVPVRDRDDLLAEAVKEAIMPDADRRRVDAQGSHWHEPRMLVQNNIRSPRNFIGREDAIYDIDSALWSGGREEATRPTVITGMSGVGKSTLAREYAVRARDCYAGAWWLNAERAKDSGLWDGIERGLVELGEMYVPGLARAQDRASAAHHTLHVLAYGGFDKPWLLIYDNVDDALVLDDWAPLGNVCVLATSRLRNWPETVCSVEIDEWTLPEAVRYLRQETGTGRKDITDNDFETLAAALGCLPLALSHAAAYLKKRKTVTAAAYMEDLSSHMRGLPKDAKYRHTVYATLRAAVAQAEDEAPGAQAVMGLASFFAPDNIPQSLYRPGGEPCPPELAKVIAERRALDDALGALDDFSLIDFDPGQRTFSVHRLVQGAVREELMRQADGTEWSATAISAISRELPDAENAVYPHAKAAHLIPHALAAIDNNSQAAGIEAPLAHLLSQTGLFLGSRAHYAVAETLQARALELREKTFGKSHPSVATSLSGLAAIDWQQGRFKEAETRFTSALAIRESSLGPQHDLIATSCNNLGVLYISMGRCAEAEPLLARAVKMREALHGPEDELVAADLNSLGALYLAMGRYPEAERLLLRSQAISEKAHSAASIELAPGLSTLGDLCMAQGRYQEAEQHYARTLAIRQAAFGPEHPEVAIDLLRLGQLLFQERHVEQAEWHFQRAVGILERKLGREHPDVATALLSLAGLEMEQGRYERARQLYQRASAIRESHFGTASAAFATCLHALAELDRREGRYEDAEPLYKRAQGMLEQALGSVHPEVAAVLGNLAQLYQVRGRGLEAARAFEQAQDLWEKAYGAEHPNVAAVLGNRAFLCWTLRAYAEAEALYRRALVIQEKVLRADHPDLARTRSNLALAAAAMSRPSDPVG
jgi:tetratricopeptide (TPR) repeat protein